MRIRLLIKFKVVYVLEYNYYMSKLMNVCVYEWMDENRDVFILFGIYFGNN